MYQALYRKHRPRCFSDVTGQEHITETLRQQIIKDRLSHAYLFVGTRGTGKTTCAKILSRAVNCLNAVDGEPCNKCLSCVGIEDGSILDVLELDAASNNSVDNVRALRDEAVYSPATVKRRVYIIDEVHMLSLSAFNALLKILEEPPDHILFILATTELHKVPATIQGRCQKFSFKRLSPAVIAKRLDLIASREGLSLTEDAVERLAALADGSMRDAISLLDQCAYDDIIDLTCIQNTLGLAGQRELISLIESIFDRDLISSLGILSKLYNDGKEMFSLLNEMASLMRDLLIFKLSPDSGLLINISYSHTELSALSTKITPERLFFCLDILKAANSSLQRGSSSRLSVEMCLIKMCDEKLSGNTEALLSRISDLEKCGVSSIPAQLNTSDVPKSPDAPKSPKILDMQKTLDEPDESNFSEPETQHPVELPKSGDFWFDILELLKGEPSVHALLSDSKKVNALLQDNILSLNITDSFTANLIESEFSGLLNDISKKTLGHDVIVKVEVVDVIEDSTNKRSKLESLSAFDIVDFG